MFCNQVGFISNHDVVKGAVGDLVRIHLDGPSLANTFPSKSSRTTVITINSLGGITLAETDLDHP
jgi:hypothetical protein